ncbi:hypothetical protein LVD17_02760 [Fulvivirga ulvae]|uniref:hypothetical protein n=1 Tax=Fulvivirga ulvae TaxID=2904245 RepID=UPI001F23AA09|nr:hypothetical protein [Fulvivirga ulvae]UII32753.1 hypothetical protein LVD17_02760 [Fulvivirga ulvae]
MKKLIVGFILSLLVYLIGGYSQQFAHVYKNHEPGSSLANHLKKTHQSFNEEREVLTSRPYSSHAPTKHIIFEVPENCEEEESESVSSRTHPGYAGFLIGFPYKQSHQHLFSYLRKAVPSGRQSLNILSPGLYLILQVFRI